MPVLEEKSDLKEFEMFCERIGGEVLSYQKGSTYAAECTLPESTEIDVSVFDLFIPFTQPKRTITLQKGIAFFRDVGQGYSPVVLKAPVDVTLDKGEDCSELFGKVLAGKIILKKGKNGVSLTILP